MAELTGWAKLISELKKLAPKRQLLHHYTSPAGLMGILQDACLWATDARFMNDPTETKYAEEVLLSSLASMSKQADFEAVHLSVLKEHVISARKDTYVISFCENPDLLSMWVYYAAGGYSIGFEQDLLFKSREVIGLRPDTGRSVETVGGPVIYDPQSQQQRTLDELIKVFNSYREQDEAGFQKTVTSFLEDFANFSLFFKNRSYQDEREHRFIIRLDPADSREVNSFRLSSTGTIVPYIRMKIPVSQKVIRLITLHPTADHVLAMAGIQSIFERLLQTGCPEVVQSKIPLRRV